MDPGEADLVSSCLSCLATGRLVPRGRRPARRDGRYSDYDGRETGVFDSFNPRDVRSGEYELMLKSLAAGDIEAGATAMLRFLERVKEHESAGRLPTLSDLRILQRAIRRYQKYMSVRQRDTNLLPPLDVAFIWHCHLLNPRDYITACNQAYFKAVEPYDDIDYAGTGDQEYAEDMWVRTFPNEPWELSKGLFIRDDDTLYNGSYFQCDTTSIQEEALRQLGFMDSLRRRNIPWDSPPFLHGAAVRYMKYLHLAGKFPHVTMVPTKDIDIIWHAHLRRPGGYAQDTENIAGRVLYHNDTIREDELNRMMADTKTLWEQEYREDYLMGHRANLTGLEYSTTRDTSFYEPPPRPATPKPRKMRDRSYEQRTEIPTYTTAQLPTYTTAAPVIAPGPIVQPQPQPQYQQRVVVHRGEDFDLGTCLYDCLCCNGCDATCNACCNSYSASWCGPCADACSGCGASCDSCNRGCFELCPEPSPRVPQIPMPCFVFFLLVFGALSLLGIAFGIIIDLTGNGDTNQTSIKVEDRTFRIGHMLAGTGAMLFWTTCLALHHRSRPKQFLFLRIILFIIGGGAVGGGFALAAYKTDDCYIFAGIIMTTIGSLILTVAMCGWFLGASTVGATIPHGACMIAWGIVLLVRANGTKGGIAAPPTGACVLCPCVYNVNAGIWLVVVGGALAIPFLFFLCCYYGWATEQRQMGVDAYYRTPSKVERYSNGYTYTRAPQQPVDVYTGGPGGVVGRGTPTPPRYNTGYKYHGPTPPPMVVQPQPLLPQMDLNPGTQVVGVAGAAPSMALAGPVMSPPPVIVQQPQPGVSAVNQALGVVRADGPVLYAPTPVQPAPYTGVAYTPTAVHTPGSIRFA